MVVSMVFGERQWPGCTLATVLGSSHVCTCGEELIMLARFCTHDCAGIDGLDAVVCTLGGTLENCQVDSEGNINVINAAMEAGVKKFVLVTSIGTGDSKDAPAQQVYDTLKPVLLEKEKAEEALKVRNCICNDSSSYQTCAACNRPAIKCAFKKSLSVQMNPWLRLVTRS